MYCFHFRKQLVERRIEVTAPSDPGLEPTGAVSLGSRPPGPPAGAGAARVTASGGGPPGGETERGSPDGAQSAAGATEESAWRLPAGKVGEARTLFFRNAAFKGLPWRNKYVPKETCTNILCRGI